MSTPCEPADAAPHWLPRITELPVLRRLDARTEPRSACLETWCATSRRAWLSATGCGATTRTASSRDAGAVHLLEAIALASVASLSAGASSSPISRLTSRRSVLQSCRPLPPMPRPAVAADLMAREVPAQMVLPLSADSFHRGADGRFARRLDTGRALQLGRHAGHTWRRGGGRRATGTPRRVDGGGGIRPRLAVGRASAPSASAEMGAGTSSTFGRSYTRCEARWVAAERCDSRRRRLASLLLSPGRATSLHGWLTPAVGTNVRLRCGLEVCVWEVGAGAIKIRIGAGHTVACPRVWLFLRERRRVAVANRRLTRWGRHGQHGS